MRYARNPHRELGEVRIEDIEIDVKSRDDIPTLLLGLQHLYCDEKLRSRLFALLEQHILPDSNRNVGRPGMELWNILVMGILKQGLGCDFDRLHQLVNHYSTIREFLGHTDLWEKKRYEYQTIVDNVSLLRPELLAKVNQMFVESGHSVARKKSRKKPSKPLCGRCDSFVVETDVHYPTDVNLLWDAMRCLIRTTGRAATQKGVPGWRQWKHLSDSLRTLFHRVRITRRARPEQVEAYLSRCQELVQRVEQALPLLLARGVSGLTLVTLDVFLAHARRQMDQVERRLLKHETIPQNEKVFSLFEPHTRWISKGKAGVPVELGVPVCILEDHHGFVLHHEIMWKGSDVDYAVPMVKAAQERFPELRAVSFDRGFHSPENRRRLDDLLDDNVLPKKGFLSKAERAREQEKEFAEMRRKHPAVESAINNLEQRGLDRVLAHGADGFAQVVGLSVLALNVHRIGLLLRRKARRRRTA